MGGVIDPNQGVPYGCTREGMEIARLTADNKCMRAALDKMTAERDKLSELLNSIYSNIFNNYLKLFPNCICHEAEWAVNKMASEIISAQQSMDELVRREGKAGANYAAAFLLRAEKAEVERDTAELRAEKAEKLSGNLYTDLEDARLAYEINVEKHIAEREKLVAQNAELRKVLEETHSAILKNLSYILTTLEYWDKGNDSKVGKRLHWLCGYNPSYEPGEKTLGNIATALEESISRLEKNDND